MQKNKKGLFIYCTVKFYIEWYDKIANWERGWGMGGKLDFIYVMFIVSYVYPFLSVKGTLNRIILDLW